jgi:small subunit ribosomal protein S7
MPRRGRAPRREILPDGKHHSRPLQAFINKVMLGGRKSIAEGIVYGALDLAEEQAHRPAMDIFDAALRNATPAVEVKPRRVGGATYQVPVDIRAERRQSLAMRWLVRSARARRGHSMAEKLAGELADAANGQGATVKRREDTHRMAEANRAFVHYRW